jgi:hypothetical protein
MKSLRLAGALALVALVGTLAFASTTAAAPPRATASVTIPITTTDVTGTFNGVLTLTQFVVQNGQVVALGTLTGTLTTASGVVTTITQDVVLPLIGGTAVGSCQILHLELGPLDLNLLGVMVHLDKVVLDVTAQSGPGQLLGNLLCGVAHLLDSNAAANAIVNILNQLLGL